MAEAESVFWQQIAYALPGIFAVLVPLVLAAARKATSKLRAAVVESVAEVEQEAPGDGAVKRAEAVKRARNKLGMSGTFYPSAVVGAEVDNAVKAANALGKARKSVVPEPPGDA